MSHNIENGVKSNNGLKTEKKFSNLTNLKKTSNNEKPKFINSYGNEQIIDFDFHTTKNGVKIFIDVCSTFRSDRAKQKGYNALLYKMFISTNCKFYIGVGSLVENGSIVNPKNIEGIDGIFHIDELSKLINEHY